MTQMAELRRGWRPLVACGVGIGLGLSPISPYTAGIFATALNQEFDWPRSQILGAIMLLTAAMVLLGSSIGRLVDHVGARRVAIWSTIGLSASLAMMSAINANILSFYACWAFMAVLALGTLPLTYAKVINGWFDRARGLALGIALASTGISGAVFPFFLNYLIQGYGWRVAYLGLAALPVLIALPVLLLWLREAPVARTAAAAPETAGLNVAAAVRLYRFWASAFAAMALGAATGGLMPNLFPLLTDNGITAGAATEALAVLALSVTFGRLLAGYLLDRLWAPVVGVILIVPALAAMLVLTMPNIGLPASMFAVGAIGLIAGAEFDLVAYMTGRYFGQKHFSEIYGIQYSIFGLGAGVTPAIFGSIRDSAGSYTPVLLVSALLFVGAAALLLTMGRYPVQFSKAAA